MPSQRETKARIEHEKWLAKRGLLPTQVRSTLKRFDKPVNSIPSYKPTSTQYPSLGNGFAPTSGKKELPADAKQFPVGHLHKQGLTLITSTKPEDLQYYGGKKA